MAAEQELFQVALGLPSAWQVVRVEFAGQPGELHLYLEAGGGATWGCPQCAQISPLYDHSEERVWRHLNFFQYKAFVHARVPRVQCAGCGVKTVGVSWARPGAGFTLLFEAFALILAKQMPVATVAGLLDEHDTRLWRVVEHYVETARGNLDMSQVQQVGVDETASQRGHQYVTVAADLDTSQVLFVTEGKDAATLGAFKAALQGHGGQEEQIKTVCADLSPAFSSGIAQEFPTALLVYDRFHVMKLLNAAVDQVRRQETKEHPLLKGTRYIWLKNPQNLTARQKATLKLLEGRDLATLQAYRMKLQFQDLWELEDQEQATTFLDTWVHEVLQSDRLSGLHAAALTIHEHAEGILNYFAAPVSNGLLEGINSLIQAAKAKARGFRSTLYFKRIIYLLAGQLNFHLPLTHSM